MESNYRKKGIVSSSSYVSLICGALAIIVVHPPYCQYYQQALQSKEHRQEKAAKESIELIKM